MSTVERYRFIISGIIQGVGFRPFIYRLATSCGLNGYALNSSEGVVIDIEGTPSKINEFETRLKTETPPLAKITGIKKKKVEPSGYAGFRILPSESAGRQGTVIIPPDISTCDNCFREMSDPSDRRYSYPFTNCTDCGPRYTIIKSLPYDRSATTMSSFELCPECRKEYSDPLNRRFHAEPNACLACGPSLSLRKITGGKIEVVNGDNTAIIKRAISLLEEGKVVALKGLGGFHIACDADNPDAVNLLRQGKNRPYRPLAVMSADVGKVGEYALLKPQEASMLEGRMRPIVLLEKKRGSSLAENVSPDNGCYGVMLPYTPLHFMLLKGNYRALVMTSANNSGEPIIKSNDEAEKALNKSVDYILHHNREILVRCDDSITRWDGERFSFIRLSRGWAPYAFRTKSPEPDRLACGAELKNTFCITKHDFAYISGHIGDLEQKDTYDSYKEGICHLLNVLKVTPRLVLHDLHPDYLSTRFADEFPDAEKLAVQHHHAHILSAMAEHNIDEEVIGIALDGTGFGTDGTIWGGEILIADRQRFERYASLEPLPLPGGDAAAREPWRMTLSFLLAAFPDAYNSIISEIIKKRPQTVFKDNEKRSIMIQMIEKKINSPMTSGAGRFFAAVSSLLGLKEISTFEGEAESILEWKASFSDTMDEYKISELNFDSRKMPSILLFKEVTNEYLNNVQIETIGRKFHNTLVKLLSDTVYSVYEKYKIKKVVLTGGVFQNMLMLQGMRKKLRSMGLEPVTHGIIPTNDAGISAGQAYFISKR